MLRAELRRAEGELEDRCWAPPSGLQQWLQLTHEVENRSYLRKKQQAELQLQVAREAVSLERNTYYSPTVGHGSPWRRVLGHKLSRCPNASDTLHMFFQCKMSSKYRIHHEPRERYCF